MERNFQIPIPTPDQVHASVDTDDDREFEIDATISENKNTKRKTETDMRIFAAYLASLQETRKPEGIPDVQLDRYLTMFFSVVKKHDGNDYEPASLRGMLCSIERFLRTRNYPHSITRDIVFLNTRNALKNRQRTLRETGKEMKTFVPECLGPATMEKLNHLYNAKELGAHSPMSIINTLCFDFVVHFRMRKAIDHKQLLWGDIVLKKTPDDVEYICYQPAQNYDFCRPKLSGIDDCKIWAKCTESPTRDTVSIYKLYATKRPGEMMASESPFYLGVSTMSPLPNHTWYKATPMGVNKLNDLVRMVRDITGLSHTVGAQADSTVSGASTVLRTSSHAYVEPPSTFGLSPKGSCVTTTVSDSQTVNVNSSSPEGVSSVPRVEFAATDDTTQENDKHMSLSDAKADVRRLFTALASDSREDFVQWLNRLRHGTTNSGGILQESAAGEVSTVQLTFDLDHVEHVMTEPRLITASLKKITSPAWPDACCIRRNLGRMDSPPGWCAPETPFRQPEPISIIRAPEDDSVTAPEDVKQSTDHESCFNANMIEGGAKTDIFGEKRGYKRSYSFPNTESRDGDENSKHIKNQRGSDIPPEQQPCDKDTTAYNVDPPFVLQPPPPPHLHTTPASIAPVWDRGPYPTPMIPITDPRYAVLFRNAELFQNHCRTPAGAPTSIEEAYLMSHDHQNTSTRNSFSADRLDGHSPYVQFQLAHLRERALHLSALMAKLAAEQPKPDHDDNKGSGEIYHGRSEYDDRDTGSFKEA